MLCCVRITRGAPPPKTRYRFARQIVADSDAAAVRIAVQALLIELGKKRFPVNCAAKQRKVLTQKLRPRIHIICTVVTVYHGNRFSGGSSYHVDFRVNSRQGLVQHNHSKNRCSGRDIAACRCHGIGGGHAGTRISLRWCQRDTGRK